MPHLISELNEQATKLELLESNIQSNLREEGIELNRLTNGTLEVMARALFKSWFVDFDPVKSKAEGRVPFGMSAETAALFPKGFVEVDNDNFPLIPEGWKLTSLTEIAHYENGLALQNYRPRRL